MREANEKTDRSPSLCLLHRPSEPSGGEVRERDAIPFSRVHDLPKESPAWEDTGRRERNG